MSSDADRAERAGELLAAWCAAREQGAREQGEGPTPEELLERHPDLATELNRGLDALRLLDVAFGEDASAAPPTGRAGPEGSSPRPERIGDFRILREVGRGGMGVVYEADQVSMRRRVALKVLYPSVTRTRRAVERFRREAQAAGRLHHTNIVPVYGMGSEGGVWFYAMELVDGRPLNQIIADLRRLERRGPGESPATTPVPAASLSTVGGRAEEFLRVAHAFVGVAEALATAHAAGVVHRDVKPANLLLDGSGTIKILDFGLARVEEESAGVTVTGDVVGTPAYMSPEQARAGDVDARSDVYALGATIYEVLTHHPPFEGSHVADVLRQVLHEEPARPRRWSPRIPRDLETIVLMAMEKDPARRYASAAEMAHDLLLFAEGAAIRARRAGPVRRMWKAVRRHRGRTLAAAAILAALGGAGVLGFLWSEERGGRRREEARARELEYARLCAAGDEAMQTRGDPSAETSPFELYSRAIGLMPERYEAYLARALEEDGTWEQSLEDIRAAERHGAPRRAVHLARAYVLRNQGREAEATAEEAQAGALVSDDVASLFWESQLLADGNQVEASLPLLDQVVARAPKGSTIRYLARRTRASFRERVGDIPGAIEDRLVLRDAGDRSPTNGLLLAKHWSRIGNAAKSEAVFEETLEDVRRQGREEGWVRFTWILRREDPVWLERAVTAGLAAFPESTALFAIGGWVPLRARRLDEALARGLEAVRRDPDCHEAQALLGGVRVDRGEWEQALEPLRRAAALRETCAECLVGLAGTLRGLRRLPEALEAVEEALRRKSMNPNALVQKGVILAHMQRPEDARRTWETLLRLEPRHGAGWIEYAGVLRGLEDKAGAWRAVERALALDPRGADALKMKGILLYDEWKNEEAIAAFDASLAVAPTSAGAHGMRALAWADLGDHERAVKDLVEAERLDPDCSEYPANLSFQSLLCGRPKEALEAADRAIALSREDALSRAHRAAALLTLGRVEEAHVAAWTAIALDADLDAGWQALGQVRFARGEFAEAIAPLKRAVALNPVYTMNAVWLGHALWKSGRPADAIAAYRQALDRGHRDPRIQNEVAWWLAGRRGVSLDDARYAVAQAEDATKQAPGDPALLHTLGVARYVAGDAAGALEALQRSVDRKDGRADAFDALFLALAHRDLGHTDAARGWFAQAAALRTSREDGDPFFVHAMTIGADLLPR